MAFIPSGSETPRIPDYTLIKCIGSGSYGDVWLSKGITGLFRAIKIVWKERFPDASPFDREYMGVKEFARISLLDPNQLAVLHIGRNDDVAGGFFYYVMELADDVDSGQEIDPENYQPFSLREKIKQDAVVPVSTCISLAVNLSKALGALHQHGLIHRDVKPSNILIVHGLPKLADIGLVSEFKDGMTFVGTEGYIPPEGPGRPQADIFGLGKVIYELSTGLSRKKFPMLPDQFGSRSDRKELLELNEILLRACDPDASRRYQSAEDLRQALLLVQAGKSVRRLYSAERGFRRAIRGVFVLGIVAVFAFTGALVERKRAEASERLIEYAAGLTQARDAIEREDFGSARKQLSELTPSMLGEKEPGFEWRALNHLAKGDPAKVIREGGDSVLKIDLSSDENLLAIHDSSGMLEIFDLSGFNPPLRFEGFRFFLGMTPDDKWLVGLNDQLKLSKVSLKGEWHTFENSPENLYPIGMDGRGWSFVIDRSKLPLLIVGDNNGGCSKFPLLSEEIHHEGWEFFRGATGNSGDCVFVWVLLTEASPRFAMSYWTQGEKTIFSEIDGRPFSVGVDEIGPWGIMHTSNRELRLNKEGRRFVSTDKVFPSRVRFRQPIVSNIELLVSEDQIVHFDFRSNKLLKRLRGHNSQINDLVVGKDQLITASDSGEVRCWSNRVETSNLEYQVWDPYSMGTQVCILESKFLVVPESENRCALVDLETLEFSRFLNKMRVPFLESKEFFIGAGETGLVFIDKSSWDEISTREGTILMECAIAERTGSLFCVDRLGELFLYRSDGSTESLGKGWRHRFVYEVDPEGRRIWSVSTTQTLSCWDVENRDDRWSVELDAFSPYVAYSDEGQKLYLPLNDGTLEVREASTGKLLKKIQSGTTAPESILLVEEQNRLFIGGKKGSIQIFRKEPLQYLTSLKLPHELPLHDLHMSDDARFLVAQASTGLLQVIKTGN